MELVLAFVPVDRVTVIVTFSTASGVLIELMTKRFRDV